MTFIKLLNNNGNNTNNVMMEFLFLNYNNFLFSLYLTPNLFWKPASNLACHNSSHLHFCRLRACKVPHNMFPLKSMKGFPQNGLNNCLRLYEVIWPTIQFHMLKAIQQILTLWMQWTTSLWNLNWWSVPRSTLVKGTKNCFLLIQ